MSNYGWLFLLAILIFLMQIEILIHIHKQEVLVRHEYAVQFDSDQTDEN